MDNDNKKIGINSTEENEKINDASALDKFLDKLNEDFLSVTPEGFQKPLLLRKATNDLLVYQELFTDLCYAFNKTRELSTIIDVGAYTGLSSVFFAHLYPKATIIGLEPAVINRTVASLNTKVYPNIRIIPVALWPKKEDLFLLETHKGSQHYKVVAQENITKESLYPVAGIDMETLLSEAKIEHVDILKLSVEGLENTILKHSSNWIKKVDSLIIRTESTTSLISNSILKTVKELFKTSWQKHSICYFSNGAIEKA